VDLIFLHGPAAAGKLTVARALNARLHYGVFHNHLIVDALTEVFPFGTPPFVRLREQFWLATFREATASGTSLIFTFAPEPSVSPAFPQEARKAVEDEGGRIHFVRLLVSETEQERRIALPSRSEFAKLSDLETLRRLRQRGDAVEEPPTDLLIDTERLTADDAAASIVDAFRLLPAEPHHRYPPV
jgi:hypothetical protein